MPERTMTFTGLVPTVTLRGVQDAHRWRHYMAGFDWMGASIALAGVVLLIVSFGFVDWMRTGDFGLSRHGLVNLHFGGINQLLTVKPALRPRFATAYFGWLGPVFVVLAVVAGIAANVSLPVRWVVRSAAVAVALIGFLLTLMSLPDINQWGHVLTQDQPGGAWSHMGAQIGWYMALLGFVLVGIGGAAGSWQTDPDWAEAHRAPDPYADQRTGDYVAQDDEAGGDSEDAADDAVYVPVGVGSEDSRSAARNDAPTPPEGTPPVR